MILIQLPDKFSQVIFDKTKAYIEDIISAYDSIKVVTFDSDNNEIVLLDAFIDIAADITGIIEGPQFWYNKSELDKCNIKYGNY